MFPTLRYISTNLSEYDACMDWAATLFMADVSDDDCARIPVGYCTFLTIRLGEEWIEGNCLDQYDADAFAFAPLFDETELSPDVEAEFDAYDCEHALVLQSAVVAKQVRGHHLGAWMLAECIARFGNSHTFIVGQAGSMELGDDKSSQARAHAAERLADYWTSTVGLHRVESRQGTDTILLAAHAAHPELDIFRSTLDSAANSAAIDVPQGFTFAAPDFGAW